MLTVFKRPKARNARKDGASKFRVVRVFRGRIEWLALLDGEMMMSPVFRLGWAGFLVALYACAFRLVVKLLRLRLPARR